jgi:hypothetical protein
MNKRTYIGTVIAVIILGGIVWIARPAPYGTEGSRSGPDSQTNNTASLSSNSNGVLTAEEANFDFGTISMAAGNVMHRFKIKNTGSETVFLGKMYTSCMCTTATLKIGDKKFGSYGMPGHGFIPKIKEAIGAGEEASVEVVFDPAAHGPAGIGRIERKITIENNAGQPLEFGFTVLVTP